MAVQCDWRKQSRHSTPTVVVEQQNEQFRPPMPFEPRLGLFPELAGVDQRSVVVEQVHVLPNISAAPATRRKKARTMFSPSLKTRFALYPHSSSFWLADTALDPAFSGLFTMPITAGIVSTRPAGGFLEDDLGQQLGMEGTVRDKLVYQVLRVQC